jgi:hypothetical protein
MKRTLTVILLLAVLGSAAPPAGAFFPNVPISPRARAMGDAAVSVPDAPFATYQNPAALALTRGPAVGTSFVRPYGLDFTDLLYAGGAIPLSASLGSVGIGLRYFGVSYASDFGGVAEDNSLLKETMVSVSHGLGLYHDLHAGIEFGYTFDFYNIQQGADLYGGDPGHGWAVGIDLGLLVTLHERTKLGFLINNINHPRLGVDREELPQLLLGGVSYEPYLGVITTFEIEGQLGEQVKYKGGVEMRIVRGFFLRAGVLTNPNKIAAGFGYELKGVAVNYGYSSGGGVLAGSHQFGLTFAWGGETP